MFFFSIINWFVYFYLPPPPSKKGPFIQFNQETVPLSMDMEDTNFSKCAGHSWLIKSFCGSLLNVAWGPDTFNINRRFARVARSMNFWRNSLTDSVDTVVLFWCKNITAQWWRKSAMIACILEFQLLLFLSPMRMWNPCCPMDLPLTCPLQHTWWLPPLGKW